MTKVVANTPTYRPPECEIEGSIVSRAFDIWSLGCVFLEFITWYLGGWSYLQTFVRHRKTKDIYAFNSDPFFEIVKKEGRFGARVKPEVSEVRRKFQASFTLGYADLLPLSFKVD
jgi:serine/threonine protein kinase